MIEFYHKGISLIRLIHTGIIAFLKPHKVAKKPQHLNIEISTKCNMHCKSCYRNYKKNTPLFMSVEKFQKIVTDVSPSNICFVGFGEPMLHPDFFNFVEFASSRGIQVSVTTNGTLLEKHAEDILTSNLNSISVSLDAPNKYTYKKLRQNDSFDRIINGLRLIAHKKSKRPSIVLHYVVQRDNYEELYEFVKFSTEFKTSMIYFQPAENYSDIEVETLGHGMKKGLLLDSIQKAYSTARELKIYTNLYFWLREFESLWKKYDNFKLLPITTMPCVRPWISAHISISGDVIPCCGLSIKPEYILGNIIKEDFSHIWNNELSIQIRKDIKSGKKSHISCQRCIPLKVFDKYRNIRKKV